MKNTKIKAGIFTALVMSLMLCFAGSVFAADVGSLKVNDQTYQSKTVELLKIGAKDLTKVTVKADDSDQKEYSNSSAWLNGTTETTKKGTTYKLYTTTDGDGFKHVMFAITSDRNDSQIEVSTTTQDAKYKLFVSSCFNGQNGNKGGGSTATCDKSASAGDLQGQQTVQFTPQKGQEIVGLNIRFTADGANNIIDVDGGRETVKGQDFTVSRSGNKVSVTFDMERETYITALTEDVKAHYTLHANHDGTCNADPTGDIDIVSGSSKEVTYSPVTGYNVTSVTVQVNNDTATITPDRSTVTVNGKSYTGEFKIDGSCTVTVPAPNADVYLNAHASNDVMGIMVHGARNVDALDGGMNYIKHGEPFTVTFDPDKDAEVRTITVKTAKGTYSADADDNYIVIEGQYYRMYQESDGRTSIYLNSVPVNMEFYVNAKDTVHSILLKTDGGADVDYTRDYVDDGDDLDAVFTTTASRYDIETLKIVYGDRTYTVDVDDDRSVRVYTGDRWYITVDSDGDVTLQMVNICDDVTVTADTNYDGKDGDMRITKDEDTHSNISFTGSNPFDDDEPSTVRIFADSGYTLTSVRFKMGGDSAIIRPYDPVLKIDGETYEVVWYSNSDVKVYFDYLTDDLTVSSVSSRGVTTDAPSQPSTSYPNTNNNTVVGEAVQHNAFMAGYGNGYFGVNDKLTRAQAVSLLSRAINTNGGVIGSNYLKGGYYFDVNNNAWYAGVVNYAAAAGYLNVLSGNGYAFNADLPITRAEFIALLCEYSGADVSGSAVCSFKDVSTGHWLYRYIAYAERMGWAGGVGNGYFKPDQSLTRAEAAAMVNRVLGRTCDYTRAVLVGPRFYDVPVGHWAYYDVLEASTSHYATIGNGYESWR